MDTNAQIIADLQNRIGSKKIAEFITNWKGVPIMIMGSIQEVRADTIVFRLETPESICFAYNDTALILQGVFGMGIQACILTFDPKESIAELGQFVYIDRGFGKRSMVRVEPENPIPADLFLEESSFSCHIVDISLNGFGLITESNKDLEAAKGRAIRINLTISDQDIEIPGALVGIFPSKGSIRLAISFSQDAPNHEVVTYYITRRRAEIRREIQSAYQKAVGE